MVLNLNPHLKGFFPLATQSFQSKNKREQSAEGKEHKKPHHPADYLEANDL